MSCNISPKAYFTCNSLSVSKIHTKLFFCHSPALHTMFSLVCRVSSLQLPSACILLQPSRCCARTAKMTSSFFRTTSKSWLGGYVTNLHFRHCLSIGPHMKSGSEHCHLLLTSDYGKKIGGRYKDIPFSPNGGSLFNDQLQTKNTEIFIFYSSKRFMCIVHCNTSENA